MIVCCSISIWEMFLDKSAIVILAIADLFLGLHLICC